MRFNKPNILFRLILTLVLSSLFYCGEDNHHPNDQITSNLAPVTPTKSDRVTISIDWEYTQIPLKMEIHEPSGSQALVLWTTGSVKKGKSTPFGSEIAESKIILKPGSKKQFLLVMRNDSDHPIYFFAAPHQAIPVEHSFGFKFKCLCINHAFTVPAKETWYRVVEIRLAPDFLGDRLHIKHNLIGITKERMVEFEHSAHQSMPHEMD